MINSRSIDDLHPFVQAMCRQHIDECVKEGIRIIVTATFRDNEFQNSLYAQGRTKPGNKVTNAKGGQSMHNHRVAYDVVPLDKDGKAIWGTTGAEGRLWARIGEIGEMVGLEWGGRWKFKDIPHFQYTQGLTWQDFQNGKMIE